MPELRIVPRKYFPSIDFVLAGTLKEPVAALPSHIIPLSTLHSSEPRQTTDFMKTIDTRFSNRSLMASALPNTNLKHRRSSSAKSDDSCAYHADYSDIETICDLFDEQDSGPSSWSVGAHTCEVPLEWQDEGEHEELQSDEEWWGDVEDELDDEDEVSLAYNGSETDSDTVVEESVPTRPHALSFVQRLLWKFTKRSGTCPCKSCSSSKFAGSSSASKSSLALQDKQPSARQQTSVRSFWSLR